MKADCDWCRWKQVEYAIVSYVIRPRPIRNDMYDRRFKPDQYISQGHSMNHLSRTAFSLVELLAVLVVMSLLAVTASWAIQFPLSQSKRDYVIERIAAIDASARGRATGKDTECVVKIVPSSGRVLIESPIAPDTVLQFEASKGVVIRQVIGVPRGSDDSYSVRVGAFGSSRSYACEVGPENRPQDSRWLLVLGATGQTYILEHASDARKVLSLQ